MDRKSRDALIVQRYEAGDTLEAIGRDLGLTRERVRQIVRQLGGASAEESRAQRALAKEAEERARSAALLSRFGPTAKTMARAGFTRARAIDRLTLLHPDVVALRHFRDHHLIRTAAGRGFVRFYWIVGPRLAAVTKPHQPHAAIARVLLTRLVRILRVLEKAGAPGTRR